MSLTKFVIGLVLFILDVTFIAPALPYFISQLPLNIIEAGQVAVILLGLSALFVGGIER